MIKKVFSLFTVAILGLVLSCSSNTVDDTNNSKNAKLAICLTESGWTMYGTTNCSACVAQKKAFGEAWKYITYVNCDPHVKNSNPDLCLTKNIRKTPTWIMEVNGEEIKRLESYQLIEDLALSSGCDY